MKIRTIVMSLAADKMLAEQEKVFGNTRPQNDEAKAPLLEGHLSRCGHVLEIPDIPKLRVGDMLLFTGSFGDTLEERRVRLNVNAAYYDTTVDTWFAVIVAIVPPASHGKNMDWTADAIADIVKQSCPGYDEIDLRDADICVRNAALIGWDQHGAPPFPIMIVPPPPPADDERSRDDT